MRGVFAAGLACLLLGPLEVAACGHEPYEYPAEARSAFFAQCPENDPVCACTWDELTRKMPYEDYEAALTLFREEGRVDPRITHARAHCREVSR